MPIPPLLLAGLVGAGGELISQVPKILPSKFEKEQRARLRELQRREELGLLGLTEQERSALSGRMESRSQQAAAQAEAERNRLLAGQGAFSGAALEQAALADEARQRQETAIQQAIEEQDISEKQREEEEMRALEAADAQRAAERRQAVANVGASGLESIIGASAQSQLFQGIKEPSNIAINTLVQRYGITEDEARGYLELAAENPELLNYLDKLEGE